MRPSIEAVVETLVIDAANFEDDAHVAAFGEKNVRPDEAVEIDLLAEGAGLVVVLEDSAKPKHGHPFGSQSELNFWGRTGRGVLRPSAEIAESADRSGWPSGP